MGRGDGRGGMLQAQKNALRATLTENVLQLQERELTYFYNNFSNIANMAAIIGGFAFSGLCISTTYTGWLAGLDVVTRTIVVDLFYTFASLSIGFCLLTCIVCTALNVRGPGLALRGPEGSLKRAVDTMRKFQKHVNTMIALGIVCFHLTAMTYAWTMLSKLQTVVTVTGVLFAFLAGMASYVVVIWHELRIDQQEIVRGGFGLSDFATVAFAGGMGSRPEASEEPAVEPDSESTPPPPPPPPPEPPKSNPMTGGFFGGFGGYGAFTFTPDGSAESKGGDDAEAGDAPSSDPPPPPKPQENRPLRM